MSYFKCSLVISIKLDVYPIMAESISKSLTLFSSMDEFVKPHKAFLISSIRCHICSLFGGGGLVTQQCLALCEPMTVARQDPLSIGFSRQVYYSVSPFPSPGHLPDTGIKLMSPALQVDSSLVNHQGSHTCIHYGPNFYYPLDQSPCNFFSPFFSGVYFQFHVGVVRKDA